MPKGINKVFLLGNVGREPEIRATPGGTLIATFSLATADRQKDPAGEWQDKTEWHNLVAIGRTAEVVRDYVKKGSQLHIEGKLQTRSWDDKASGQKKYRTEIFVGELTLLGGAGQGSPVQNNVGTAGQNRAENSRETGQSTQNSSGTVDDFAGLVITDDDIPF
jgi:single-strand DNA-binding protein